MSINTALRYWLDQVLNHGPLNFDDYAAAKNCLIEATLKDQPDESTVAAFQAFYSESINGYGIDYGKAESICRYFERRLKRELSIEDLAGYKFDTSEYVTIGLHPARERKSVNIENAAWAIIRLWEKLGTITWRDMAETCAKEWGLPTTDIEDAAP